MTRAEPHTITTRLVIAAVAALALVPSLAFSQTTTTTPPASTDKQSTELETIEVTGSRIKRTDYETASPIQVLSREDIEKTGKPNIGEVLRSISADNQGTIPTSFTNGFAAGSSAVSLRGLGVNSTLVLVNGRRMAPYGLADDGSRTFVDLNSIPLEAVERIDVLKDGASALYGSDAVGGVVNIILRKNYEGWSGGTNQGISQQWDGQMGRYFANFGMGNLARDGYNGFFSIESYSSHPIGNSDRDGYLGTNDLRPWTGFDNRRMASPAGAGGGLGTANSPYGIVVHNGLFEEVTPCQERVDIPGFSAVDPRYPAGGLCVYDVIGFEEIQPDEERLNALGRLTTALGDAARMYAEASQFQTEIFARGTPGSWTFGSTYNAANHSLLPTFRASLGKNHPDNPTRPTADGGDNQQLALALRYLGADGGGRNESIKNTVNRYLVGIEGDIEAFNNAPLSYDIGAMYVKSKLDDTNYGFAHRSGVLKWINGIGGSTNAVGTTPYRVNNPAANLAYGQDIYNQMYNDIYHGDNRVATSDVTLVDGHVAMPLAELPGGPLSLAVGGEWRKETSNSPNVPGTENGEVAGLGYSQFSSDRKVYAVYAEVSAPVLPELELTAAGRYDKYSDYGNSTTPKVGFKYKPIDEFALRGTYSQAFRAPGPAESGNAASFGFTNIAVLSLGNPAVQPETADSYTVGIVAEPTDMTNVSIDYYLIKRDNEIVQADQAQILGSAPACNTAGAVIPGSTPGSFVYYSDTTGGTCGLQAPISAVGAPYQNANETETSGLDLDLRQKFNTDYGKVTAGVVWTHLISFERTINGTVYDYVGTHGPFVLSSAGGTPEDRAVISMNLDRGPWNTNVNVNWFGPMALIDHQGESLTDDGGGYFETTTGEGSYFVAPGQPVCGTYNADGTAFNHCQLSSWYTVDLVAKYAASQNWTMSFGVDNLTDKVAPLDPYTYGAVNYHPTNYQAGAVGRFFTVGLKYDFK